jgi:predicted deacylase
MHGDEVGGIVVVQELFKRLRKRSLRCGQVRAFPLMNPHGFETAARQITLSKEDLNRSFPGVPHGTLAERIAARIFETIIEVQPAVVVDLHNDWIRSIPYTVVDPIDQPAGSLLASQVDELAVASGFPIVAEEMPIERSLTHSLIERGIPAVTIELGEAYIVNETYVQLGVQSCFSILQHLGMVDPGEPFQFRIAPNLQNARFRYTNKPFSSTNGIIRFLTQPGDVIQAGQPFAKVYNAFGRLQETLSASSEALVLGHTDSSVAYPGAPVVALAVPCPQKNLAEKPGSQIV